MKCSLLLILAVVVLPAEGQLGQDWHKEREACVESLSTYAIDPETAQKPNIPDDLTGVTLEYRASGCLGKCPSFTMTIRGDLVMWEGRAFVKAKGERQTRITPQQFRELLGVWMEGKVYAMRDDYCGITCPNGTTGIETDLQDTKITLKTSSFNKSVLECYETINGKAETPKPPDAYFRLSKKLLEFARSKRWL